MTKELRYLFQPIKAGELELSNRIVFLTVSTGYGESDMVTDRLKNYIAERARGGAGLITIGILSPSYVGRGNGIGIYHDRFIPGLRELTDIVHSYEAKAAAQLCLQYVWAKGGSSVETVGPSEATARPGTPTPRPLTNEEIRQIIEEFSEAARRARDAGFDAVEFHGGIGYMINRFLSPLTNKRIDEYGGNLENRMRFLLDIIRSTKTKVGDSYPLLCRLSADEFLEGGHTLRDTKQMALIIERAGIDILNVQAGWHESPVPLIQMSVPRGAYAYLAEEIKQVVGIPVVAAYRINDPLLADQLISEGKADLIGMARPLIADPELPNKAKEGRFNDIRTCIACCHCLDSIREGKPMECTVNARAGKEAEYSIEPAAVAKKVVVIGGGPAGLEASRVAAMRGHRVTLMEKNDRLGGQLRLATIPPGKAEIDSLNQYLTNQVEKLGVEVRLNIEATVDDLRKLKPDEVVVATGASPKIPDIPGVDGDNIATALEILGGQKTAGEKVVIIGGGMIGCETAQFLVEKGKKVTILEMLERVGADIGRTSRWVVMQELRKSGVRMEAKAEAIEITPKGVMASRDEKSEFFEADTVVIAAGMIPDQELAQHLKGKVPSLHLVGDCTQPARIRHAIEAGLQMARRL